MNCVSMPSKYYEPQGGRGGRLTYTFDTDEHNRFMYEDESQTGINVRVFPALLQDRREVLTATSTSDNPRATIPRPASSATIVASGGVRPVLQDELAQRCGCWPDEGGVSADDRAGPKGASAGPKAFAS